MPKGPSIALLAVLAIASLPTRAPAAETPEKVPLVARPFELQHVRLLDGPARDALERCRRYLHDLEADRLLHVFRLNAGLPSSAEPLGGWESPKCEVCGHFVGHFLSGCALMHAATGDEALKAKAQALVAELAKCQEALGPSGYLSAFPESFIDRVETGAKVWAPWYTLHKVMAGLLDVHLHCGSRQALDVLVKMAAWAKARTDKLSDDQMARMLNVEFGGTNEVFYNLYAVTGNRDHLRLAERFDHQRIFEPLAAHRDELKGLHANTNIPKIIGAARRYELTADPRAHEVAHFFWHSVVDSRCYVTGGTSNCEHWRTPPKVLATELSTDTQECCCTYNMLKLTRKLFGWTADPEYAEYYERALLNSVLGTQNPADGMMMYFIPLAPGYWKLFNTPRDSFWCCTGTGVESFSKLADSIYFHDDRGLWVNLFMASQLDWPEKGLRLRQETTFPDREGTTLIVGTQRPLQLALRIRIPRWTAGPAITVNGKPAGGVLRPGSYAVLDRTWNDGDRVEVTLPMHLRSEPMPDDPTVQAFCYGPLVLAGRLGSEGLGPEVFHSPGQLLRAPAAGGACIVTEGDAAGVPVRPVALKRLVFETVGQSPNTELIPLDRLFGERYAVYWQVLRKGSEAHRKFLAEQAAREALRARLVDECGIGDRASDVSHHLQGKGTQAGLHGGRNWRHAVDGGWFSWTMKALPEGPLALRCTYWGDEGGRREFDVLVDGRPIATQKLSHNQPGEFFDVEYPIPPELTRGKQQITVKFAARPGQTAGGVFGCAVVTRKPSKQ